MPEEQPTYPIDYSANGADYTLYEDLTATVKTITADRVDLVIPEAIDYESKSYAVTALGDNIFQNSISNYDIYSVTFPSAITNVSEKAFNTYAASAIVWKSNTALPSTAFSNEKYSNGNFLLYVNSKSIAPSSVKNVVVNGVAESITLKDGYAFNCPQAFTAKSISYTHNYQMTTGVGESAGWETLALPFTVQTVTHESKGKLVTFANYSKSSGLKPFWLYKLTNSGFAKADKIEANTPYLISMPNNSKYSSDYQLAGKVTFAAENAQVLPTASDNWHTATYNGGTFYPVFNAYATSSSTYALNVNNDFFSYSGTETPGSIFISNYRTVNPFEGRLYSTSANSRALRIAFANETSLGIEDIIADGNSCNIYDIRGQLIRSTKSSDIEKAFKQLPKGIYIINGRKVAK